MRLRLWNYNLQNKYTRRLFLREKKCPYCEKTVLSTKYRFHLLLHSYEKPHKCSICQVRFSEETDLDLHMTSLHKSLVHPERSHVSKIPHSKKPKKSANDDRLPAKHSSPMKENTAKTQTISAVKVKKNLPASNSWNIGQINILDINEKRICTRSMNNSRISYLDFKQAIQKPHNNNATVTTDNSHNNSLKPPPSTPTQKEKINTTLSRWQLKSPTLIIEKLTLKEMFNNQRLQNPHPSSSAPEPIGNAILCGSCQEVFYDADYLRRHVSTCPISMK